MTAHKRGTDLPRFDIDVATRDEFDTIAGLRKYRDEAVHAQLAA